MADSRGVQRVHGGRHSSPLRKPWHVDYLHQRDLTQAIMCAASQYVRGRMLDVGCGRRPYAPWLHGASAYVGFDVPQAGDPSVCGLAYDLPFMDQSFDTVISTQTLEHIEEPQRAVAEMARVLRPGGYMILTVPQTWRLHEKPYDFYRYTRYGLRYMIEHAQLEVIEVVPQGGVWITVGQTINNAIHRTIQPHIPLYATYLLYLFSNMWFGSLDRWWVDTDETLNYLAVARRPR
jgi:SAM-dependent methyltransferase